MRGDDRHSSVTSLLMLGVLSATLLYSLIFLLIASSQFQVTADRLNARVLRDQAGIVAGFVGKDARHALPGDGLYQYIVRDAATGRVIERSPGADPAAFPASAADSEYFSFAGPKGAMFRGASVRTGDRVIQVAQDERSIRAFSDMLGQSMLTRLSLFGIPFLALLMLVVALSIKLIMTPISKALNQLGDLSFNRPDLRLDVSGFPSEIQPLAAAINGALDRIGRGIEAQKDFVANAAHELRTPLAVLRAHIDTMNDWAEAAKMRDDVDSMARLVSQLLDTARLDAPEPPELRRIDLTDLARETSRSIWPLVLARGRTLEVKGLDAPVYVQGNFDLLCRAVRNLLENALHHTPPGAAIELEVQPGKIVVRDRGQGVADDRKAEIFKRFSRGDSRQGGGAGLGLFIVGRIMELHGGAASVDDAEGGGAAFTLQFHEKLDKKPGM